MRTHESCERSRLTRKQIRRGNNGSSCASACSARNECSTPDGHCSLERGRLPMELLMRNVVWMGTAAATCIIAIGIVLARHGSVSADYSVVSIPNGPGRVILQTMDGSGGLVT